MHAENIRVGYRSRPGGNAGIVWLFGSRKVAQLCGSNYGQPRGLVESTAEAATSVPVARNTATSPKWLANWPNPSTVTMPRFITPLEKAANLARSAGSAS